MKSPRINKILAAAMVAAFPAALWAQGGAQVADAKTPPAVETKAPAPATDTAKITVEKKQPRKFMCMSPAIEIQNYRPTDMRGINV